MELVYKTVPVPAHQTLVAYRVRERKVVLGGRRLDGRVGEVGGEGRGGDRLVVHRPEVEVDGVARDGHVRGDQQVPLVDSAGELLEQVGVVGERAEGVVWGGCGVRAAAEPHAGACVEKRVVHGAVLAQGGVVGVGGVLVGAPGGRRVKHAVLVRHDNVPLAGGLAGEAEGDPRHAALRALLGLDEGQVSADHLVGGGVRVRGEVHHDALLAHLEGAAPALVEEVPVRGAGLGDDVGAEGQGVRARRGGAVLPGHERADDLAGLEGRPVHDDGALGGVGHLEPCAGERGGPERQRRPLGAAVALL